MTAEGRRKWKAGLPGASACSQSTRSNDAVDEADTLAMPAERQRAERAGRLLLVVAVGQTKPVVRIAQRPFWLTVKAGRKVDHFRRLKSVPPGCRLAPAFAERAVGERSEMPALRAVRAGSAE
jgi:hypothetical protein